MRANCARHDEAILMLVHGELDVRRAVFLRAHLAVCPHCRARKAQLERVTRSFAVALANPRLGIRPIVRPVVWASVGLLAVLIAILGMLVSADVAAAGVSFSSPTPPHAKASLPIVSLSHCGLHGDQERPSETQRVLKGSH